MIALIDADSIIYKIGYTSQQNVMFGPHEEIIVEDLSVAISRLDAYIFDILVETGAKDYILFLSPPITFRKKEFPEYKANRTGDKPILFESLYKHIMDNLRGYVYKDYEADDVISIQANRIYKYNDRKVVICHIDKDLNQIPGLHFNYAKRLLYRVSHLDAVKYLYTQLLMGDSSDNIKGVPKIGPKTAAKILEKSSTEEECSDVCKEEYRKYYKERWESEYKKTKRLVELLK